MPKQEGQKSKLVTLLRILEQRTDETHRLNVPQLVQLLEHRRLLFLLLRLLLFLLVADESYFSHDSAPFPNFSMRSSRASSHGVSGPYLFMRERKRTTSSRTQRKV